MEGQQWTPDLWHSYPARQQPEWPDKAAAEKIGAILRRRLPLVSSGEIESLRSSLAGAAEGRCFLLQGGDCAERFTPDEQEIRDKLRVLMQMSVVLIYGAGKPVIKVGRFAGQYGKPRSEPVETIDGAVVPSFFGDIVNRPDPLRRTPDPKNLLDAYNFSASTLNLIRGLSGGGFADLHRVHRWNADFVRESPAGHRYEELAGGIDKALRFMQACGISAPQTGSTGFFSSHEALILDYEAAMTRQDPDTGLWYDLSAHMLWLGARTAHPDEAHARFLSGIANPLGIKVGPETGADQLLRLLDLLDPLQQPGRITLITRFGAGRIREGLPPLLRAVQAAGRKPVWSCDPMHGNTIRTAGGYKTRDFETIRLELGVFLDLLGEAGLSPGGVHLELTGSAVTECLGGADRLEESDLARNYETACDSRLNGRQALELAFLLAGRLGR